MSNKGGNIFEKYSDKIILAVIGLVSLFILARTFVMSPHSAEIGGASYGPSSIDREIQKRAQDLREIVEEPAKQEKENYAAFNQREKFQSFLGNSLRDFNDLTVVVDTSLSIPIPSPAGDESALSRKYQVPDLVELENPQVNLFRSVAYVPLERVNMEHPYETVNVKAEDLDFVSFQAELDVKKLYENFYDSFAGRSVKNAWKDSTLAVPVFAKVGLERKTIYDDGSESQWQSVPYTRINRYRELYSLPENISDFDSSGLRTIYARLGAPDAKKELLQPSVYEFAYPGYAWLAPEYDKIRQEEIEKQERFSRRTSRDVQRETRPERRRPERQRNDQREMNPGMPGMPGMGPAMPQQQRPERNVRRNERDNQRPQRRPGIENQPEETIDVEEQFMQVEIDEETDISQLDKLVVWAHDDTAEPGKTYKYRLRVGIANPIAGVSGASWENAGDKDGKLVFWTDYVEAAATIEIPKRMYVFATDIKREADKTVSFEVAKYNLGNWYKHEFFVRPGDSIGKDAEVMVNTGNRGEEEAQVVDFSTGSVMLDIEESKQWTGTSLLRSKDVKEVLYTNGEEIARMAAKKINWNSKTTEIYNDIQERANNPIELDTSSRGSSRSRQPQNQNDRQFDPMMPMPF